MSNEFASFDISKLDLEGGSKTDTTNTMDNYVKLPEKEGYLIVRLLPPMVGQTVPFVATQLHYMGTYPSSKTYHCIRQRVKHPYKNQLWWGNPSGNPKDDCPICAEYGRLWKLINKLQDGDPQKDRLKLLARQYKGNARYYWNVIIRSQVNPKTNEKEENIGPKILSLPEQTHNLIITNMKGDPDAGIKALGDVTNPLTGRDFRIVKKIKKADGKEFPNYELSKFEDPSPLGTEEQIAIWKANMHNLSSLRVLLTPAQLGDVLKEQIAAGSAPASSGTNEWETSQPQTQTPAVQQPVQPPVQSSVAPALDESGMEEDFAAALARITNG